MTSSISVVGDSQCILYSGFRPSTQLTDGLNQTYCLNPTRSLRTTHVGLCGRVCMSTCNRVNIANDSTHLQGRAALFAWLISSTILIERELNHSLHSMVCDSESRECVTQHCITSLVFDRFVAEEKNTRKLKRTKRVCALTCYTRLRMQLQTTSSLYLNTRRCTLRCALFVWVERRGEEEGVQMCVTA